MKNAVTIVRAAALASVLLLTACKFGFDERPKAAVAEFIPVEEIIRGIPASHVPFVGMSLWGTVMPDDATNKKIEWSIKDDGGTNPTLEVNRLTANGEGTVTVTALIKDGLAEGTDYTQDFDIEFSLTAAIPVIEIRGIPSSITRGTYTLNGTIIPTNASKTVILWSVKEAGTTGASIDGDILTTTSAGTAVLTATVANGSSDGDYTQDFTIAVTKNVYLAGHYKDSNDQYKACYWIDEQLYDLDLNGIPNGTRSITTGIVSAGGKQYISGGYGEEIKTVFPYSFKPEGSDPKYSIVYTYTTTACYWVDGVRHDLTGGTETLSIAANGDDVYITGFNRTGDVNSYCYWKIDGNGGETKTPLTLPSAPTNPSTPPSVSGRTGRGYIPVTLYVGRIAVSGVNVYIPFYYQSNIPVYTINGDAPENLNYVWDNVAPTSYYWDKDGNSNLISFDCAVNSVSVVNGNVYIAGFMRPSTGFAGCQITDPQKSIFPFYWVMGTANPNFNPGSYNIGSLLYTYDYNGYTASRGNISYDDGVASIVAQNGTPWFYCTRSGNGLGREFRYDTAGNEKYLPGTDYMYDAGKVVFSDGDVYIVIRETPMVNYNFIGYAVLDGDTVSEKQTIVLIDPDGNDLPKTGQISGIAVP